jgi:hypothetical protein
MELLFQHGAHVNHADNQGITPLMTACKSGSFGDASDIAILKALIEHGAAINAQAKDGSTPLIFAAKNSHQTALRFLLDAGADPNLNDAHGETPLSYATALGSKESVDYLKQKGAKDISPHLIAPQFTPPALTPSQAWAMSLAAIYFQESGHPQMVLGSVRDVDQSEEWEKQSLKSGWNITDHSSLLATLDELLKEGHRSSFIEAGRLLAAKDEDAFTSYLNGPLIRESKKSSIRSLRDGYLKWKERLGLAFDLCRYANLVSKGVRSGFITEEEGWDLLTPVTRIAQKNFTSWQELGENFLNGRAAWKTSEDSNSEPDFEAILRLLSNPKDPNSPWNQVPWNADLSSPIKTPNKDSDRATNLAPPLPKVSPTPAGS